MSLPTCLACNTVILPGESVSKTTVDGHPRYSHKSTCSPRLTPDEKESAVEVEAVQCRGDQFRAEEVLATLDAEQRAAVVAPLGPLRILAGAGTGKTRALTHRIAYQHHLGVAPTS